MRFDEDLCVCRKACCCVKLISEVDVELQYREIHCKGAILEAAINVCD